jgi:hypothetical protein
MFKRAIDISKSNTELQADETKFIGTHTRAMAVAESETIRASYKLFVTISEHWNKLLWVREHLKLVEVLIAECERRWAAGDAKQKPPLEQWWEVLRTRQVRVRGQLQTTALNAQAALVVDWTDMEFAIREEIRTSHSIFRWRKKMSAKEFKKLTMDSNAEAIRMAAETLKAHQDAIKDLDKGKDPFDSPPPPLPS